MAEREYIWAVALKIQSAQGTDSVPTFALNAVRHVGAPTFLTINHLDEGDASDQQFGGLGVLNQLDMSGEWGQIDVTLAVKGAGADYFTATNRPEWDAPLRASGFVPTASGTGGSGVVKYKPIDSGTFEYLSAYLQGANKLYKMVDCVAMPKFAAEAAKKGTFTFTIIGRITSITESAYAGQTLSAVVAPPFKGAVVSLGAWASSDGANPLVMRDVAIDFGIGHTPRESAGATDGLLGFEVNDRKIVVSSTIEVVPLSKFDPWAESRVARPNATSRKPVFQIGIVQFNRVKFSLGEWGFKPPAPQGKNRLMVYPLSGPLFAQTHANGTEMEITVD
jgi:hypothetical protein